VVILYHKLRAEIFQTMMITPGLPEFRTFLRVGTISPILKKMIVNIDKIRGILYIKSL